MTHISAVNGRFTVAGRSCHSVQWAHPRTPQGYIDSDSERFREEEEEGGSSVSSCSGSVDSH